MGVVRCLAAALAGAGGCEVLEDESVGHYYYYCFFGRVGGGNGVCFWGFLESVVEVGGGCSCLFVYLCFLRR